MKDGRPRWMIERELVPVWDGTRRDGRNPSLYGIGQAYTPPMKADTTSTGSRISMERGTTRHLILDFLEQNVEGTISEIAASVGATTSKDYQRINVMAWKLKNSGVISGRREQRYTDQGRPYRCIVYSKDGRSRPGFLKAAA